MTEKKGREKIKVKYCLNNSTNGEEGAKRPGAETETKKTVERRDNKITLGAIYLNVG